jgi:hypothetical protein
MFRVEGLRNKNEVHLDPHTLRLMVLTTASGWLMIAMGLAKNLLERRRNDRVCPSCGRNADSCSCG